MKINFKCKIWNDEEKFSRSSEGYTEIDIEKFKKVEKQVFDFGYSLGDFIQFIIENINEESVESLLFTMDNDVIETTDE